MRKSVLIFTLLLAGPLPALRAGSVLTLANSPEFHGKLTLGSSSIHVEGNAAADVNLSDILEADFSDEPFLLYYFSSIGSTAVTLPSPWQAENIGALKLPGSVSFSGGSFTLIGGGEEAVPAPPQILDSLFFVGQSWPGNGEWTAHLQSKEAWGDTGLMLRDGPEAGAAMFALVVASQGNGGLKRRTQAGHEAQFEGPLPWDVPLWLRLTRCGNSVEAAISTDGKSWDLVHQEFFKNLFNPEIGLFVESRRNKKMSQGVFDQVTFAPIPCEARVIPPGLILQSGSFLAGQVNQLLFDANSLAAPASFIRHGGPTSIPRNKIAAITMLATPRSAITDMGAQAGVLLKNGDVATGDFQWINQTEVNISSLILGPITYKHSEVSACVFQATQPQPAPYEIRLNDGSFLYASGLTVNNNYVEINEISGVTVRVTADEIAQFRAGPAVAQSLLEVPWKATSLPVLATVTAGSVTPPPAPDPAPTVASWQGPHQEQIMAVTAGTTLDFPLAGKFRAVSMKIALSPDAPPNGQATLRILADGKELGRTPPFTAGEQPRFMEVTVQQPRTVTFTAESSPPGIKVLLIDPVALRAN
jgi:hypothetical protein